MKFFGVFEVLVSSVFFGVFAVLLVTVNGSVNSKIFRCPSTSGVSCLQDPCRTPANTCVMGQICCANYTKGCNVNCYQCPPTTGVSCFQDPCNAQPNACPGQSCCPDYTTGCNVKCY